MSNKKNPNTIVYNKKINFEYKVEETFEAGLVLEGWMVKALREKRVSVSQGVYVQIKNGEAYLVGLMINPLESTSTHHKVDPQPTIKLLLKKKEISTLIGKKERDGYTIVLRDLYFKKQLIKGTIAVAKGKNSYDKRQTIKERDSKREASRAIKKHL